MDFFQSLLNCIFIHFIKKNVNPFLKKSSPILTLIHWEKNAIESKAFLSKSMYTMDSNQYTIELVTYLLVLVVYFY